MSHSRQRNGARIAFVLLILSLFAPLLFIFPVEAQTVVMRFAIIGDYGNNSSEEIAVANMVKSWNPAFIITTGDNNYPDGAANTIDNNIGQHYSAYIGNYQGTYGAGSPSNRFFPSLGNHDWITAGAIPYLNYFTLPGNERYYDFVWGPVHFFAVDSDGREPDGTSASSVQANWLRTRLAASTSQWQVVYFHHPPYGSSSVHSPTTTMRWPFLQWGADMVLSGHNHQYERLDVGGLTYIVNGLGGRSRYGFGSPVPESQIRYNASWGAQLVTVYNCQMVFEFWSILGGGTLIDRYTLGTCGGNPNPTPSHTATGLIPTATRTPTRTPTPIPQATILANADAYVDAGNRHVNFGSNNSLYIDSRPEMQSFMRFTVPSGTGTITRAVLRVYALSALGSPFSLATTDGSWSESSITYHNAPAIGGTIANSPTGSANSWIEIDVSSQVRSAGQYNFVMFTTSDTTTRFSGREGANAPRLILTLGQAPAPTATRTPTRTPTGVIPTATRTPTRTPTTIPSGSTITLNPIGDTYINSDTPATNFGTNASLRTDASPVMRTYLRFDVPSGGTISSATLRVFATSANTDGYTVQRSSPAWDELSLTYNTAPPPSGNYGVSGSISANSWTQVNITSMITGPGIYSIVMTSTSTTTTAFNSREAANRPQLVIVYAP